MTAIDLARVRRALDELDRIAAESPAAFRNFTARGWLRVLDEEEAVGETKVVAFRLPAELLERLDAHAARLAELTGGVQLSRADVVKALLSRALDQAETEAKPKKRR